MTLGLLKGVTYEEWHQMLDLHRVLRIMNINGRVDKWLLQMTTSMKQWMKQSYVYDKEKGRIVYGQCNNN